MKSVRGIARVSVVGVIALAWGGMTAVPAQAATFTVTKTADTADGACNADCSLREAVIAANTGAGPDTINVPAGTFLLTITGAEEDASASGDLDIDSDVTLVGTGASSTIIDGNGTVTTERVLQISDSSGPDVQVSISGVTVRGGREDDTSDRGGGIWVNDGGELNLTNSTVTDNAAVDWFSGGVDVDGEATIMNSTISNNFASQPGGAMEVEGTASLTNVTFSGNRTNEDGGAITVYSGDVSLNNVTITGNRADDDGSGGTYGGGIANNGGAITIRNSILANNTVGAGSTDPDCSNASGSITSQGHNLVEIQGTCTFAGSGDITGQDPNLGALANNGGPTFTHALLAGSPAIDKGDPSSGGPTSCASADQRGAPRQGQCDIGAYELVQCLGTAVNRIGTAGDDNLMGTDAADGFLAFGGNDTASGLGGDDRFCLGDGNDTGLGGSGKDLLQGELGNDVLKGQGGNDTASGGTGKDKASGGAGKDRLKGDEGNDTLRGQGGNDRLKGGPGRDTCVGGPGRRDRATCEIERSVP